MNGTIVAPTGLVETFALAASPCELELASSWLRRGLEDKRVLIAPMTHGLLTARTNDQTAVNVLGVLVCGKMSNEDGGIETATLTMETYGHAISQRPGLNAQPCAVCWSLLLYQLNVTLLEELLAAFLNGSSCEELAECLQAAAAISKKEDAREDEIAILM